MSFAQRYTAKIRTETRYFAAWLPGAIVRLGDYGSVDGSVFQSVGNVSDLPEILETEPHTIDTMLGVTRELSPQASIDGDAGIATGQALIEITFNDEVGILISAVGARETRIADLTAFADRLRSTGQLDSRSANWFVYELTTVQKATIVASQEGGVRFRFNITGKPAGLAEALASVSGASSTVMERHAFVKIIGQGPLTPLFRLARLKRRLFSDPVLSFRGENQTPADMVERYDLGDGDVLEVY
jgi:hypothetical protein